jgi:multidrug resistance efflux pump
MRWKVVLAAVALLAAVAAGLGFFWPFGRKADVLHLYGSVEIQEVRLGSKIGGRVAEVRINEGDKVEPGQVLLVLEVPELEAQRDQIEAKLQEAQAQLEKAEHGPREEEKDAARAALEAARARLDRLIAGFREEEKRQSKNELEAAEADLKLAREEFTRIERLYRQNATTQSEYDAARASMDRSLGRAAAARARYDMMIAGARQEDIDEGKAELKRAEANWRLLRAGTRYEEIDEVRARVAEMRGKLKELEANLKEAVVRAPEAAVVEVLAVRKGDLMAPNVPVIRVLRRDDLWVKVFVPETDLGKVRLNQTVEVTVDSYPGRRLTGTVIQIASESEFTPRNIQSIDERRHQVFAVKVRVDDPQGIFKSGMAAEVFIPLLENKE